MQTHPQSDIYMLIIGPSHNLFSPFVSHAFTSDSFSVFSFSNLIHIFFRHRQSPSGMPYIQTIKSNKKKLKPIWFNFNNVFFTFSVRRQKQENFSLEDLKDATVFLIVHIIESRAFICSFVRLFFRSSLSFCCSSLHFTL